MASVIHKTPNPESLQYTYLDSVNTPDYDEAYWLHNPDVHDLVNSEVPQKYWKTESYYEDGTAELYWRVVEMNDTEKSAVEAAIPEPVPAQVVLQDELRDSNGKLRVHQSSRKDGLAIHWTSTGDDVSNPTNFGSGTPLSYRHLPGDATSEIVYIDFNSLLNESWIHEVVLTWAKCDLDVVTVDIVPDTCMIQDSTAGDFDIYGPIVIPAMPGQGCCNIVSDVLAYRGGLVAQDSPSDPTITPGPAFWNADFNESTGRFENLTPAPGGDGAYNIFHEERALNRLFNRIQLLQSGFQIFNSSDTDQITHGLRIRCTFNTTLPDHEWTISAVLVMHRNYVNIKADDCI